MLSKVYGAEKKGPLERKLGGTKETWFKRGMKCGNYKDTNCFYFTIRFYTIVGEVEYPLRHWIVEEVGEEASREIVQENSKKIVSEFDQAAANGFR